MVSHSRFIFLYLLIWLHFTFYPKLLIVVLKNLNYSLFAYIYTTVLLNYPENFVIKLITPESPVLLISTVENILMDVTIIAAKRNFVRFMNIENWWRILLFSRSYIKRIVRYEFIQTWCTNIFMIQLLKNRKSSIFPTCMKEIVQSHFAFRNAELFWKI